MRSAARGLFWHLAGYAAVHVIAGVVLAWTAATTFAPGGETPNRSEAVMLHLFITAVLLACSGVGYAVAIAFAAQSHQVVPAPAMFGVVSGAFVCGLAGVGGVKTLEGWLSVSTFPAAVVLGFMVGVGASVAVAFASGAWQNQKRA